MTTRFARLSLAALILLAGTLTCQRDASATLRSIILIVADGTGIGQHSLSYYQNDRYSPASFEHVGLMTTHPSNRQRVTDSAAAATAFSTGVKTYNGAIAVNDAKEPLKTVLEYSQELGMATGLVATSSITHATPAAFIAHVDSRQKEDIIAQQMAEAGVTVLFGGGRMFFLSKEQGGAQETDLLAAMSARGVQVVDSLNQAVDEDRPVVGLFHLGAMPPAHENRKPTTTDMAMRALSFLENDPDGFFLMVEESQVDWGSHGNSGDYVKAEMASLNNLVDALLEYQSLHPDVLVLLVADHETGGLSVANEGSDQDLSAHWTSGNHTGNMVPIFASGPGSERFDAIVDNTFIGESLIHFLISR